MSWNITDKGEILNLTGGLQDDQQAYKGDLNRMVKELREHAECVVGSMKVQETYSRYFVHRDMVGSRVLNHPWIDHQIRTGRISMITGPSKEFTLKNRKVKRQVCWLTNSDCIAN